MSQARRREAHKARKITTEVRGWIATLIRQELSPEQVVDYLARHKHRQTKSALLAKAAVEGMEALKAKIVTITLDNELEFARHEFIAKGLGADIYFAHPCASWARGINENTHGLIRQYFPKGTNFNEVSDEHIKQIMDRLNNRPGKTRGGRSPNELFIGQQAELLAA